jgi:anaphase-promoting complex subunit 1
MSSCPPNFRIWPEFHNGVAAGLRLPEASSDGGKIITRTWIKFNKPASQSTSGSNNNTNQNPPSYAHGGFLMALGLRGHLAALNTSDLTDYLSQGTITTTVGVFLGMAANKRGSCDPGVSKMLCLHVPSLLPPSFIPMDLASTVQAAAVAGIGLLYQKSSHRLMTEFLLNEIGRQPTKDQNTNDRESFALVCGLSLGLINLQKGKSTVSGLEDLKIEERLHRYISGVGADKFQTAPPLFPNGNQTEGDRNARILESDMLNRDITAPGSILALGLMYIKSGNVSVASILKLPDTHFLLDYIRPDFLALRVLAKSLILWNVEPTAEWIDSQVPTVVKNSVEFMRKAAEKAVSLGIGMDEDTDRNGDESKKDVADFDPQAVRQANTFIIAGACFSIGIRYAGSANREAAAAIFQRVLWLLELRDNKEVTRQVQRPDLTTLTTCLCTCAISLALVLAGTGDLDSFRLFRALRWSCDDSVSYGTHMIYGAAIGLLFLGGGKRTLGSNPEDVAMLIAAFFPHYPILSSDNQYHLQALRHMYVLAAHDRILESVDVDSREKVCIPIELAFPDTPECMQSSTPFLVANNSNFVELRTKTDRYYPIVLKTSDWSSRGIMSNIFVKRKPGHLGYLQDPNALRALSIQAGSTNSESVLKSIKMMSDDSVLASFAKYFCKANKNKGSYPPELLPEANSDFLRYCNLIANDCMQEEKSEMLPLYLTLYRLMKSMSGPQSVSNVWDLRILRSYMRRKGALLPPDEILASVNLISQELIALVCEHIDDTLESAAGMDESKGEEPTVLAPAEKVWYEVPLRLPS